MFRPDHPTADSGKYTEGDVAQGIPATVVTADHLNAITEEIINVILGAGLTLDKNINTQLRDSIGSITGNPIPKSALVQNFDSPNTDTVASTNAIVALLGALLPNGSTGRGHNQSTSEELNVDIPNFFLQQRDSVATIWVHREGVGMKTKLYKARGSINLSYMSYGFAQFDGLGGDGKVTSGVWDPSGSINISMDIGGTTYTTVLTKLDNSTLKVRRAGAFAGTGDSRFNIGVNGKTS